jgi:hypothetical protein
MDQTSLHLAAEPAAVQHIHVTVDGISAVLRSDPLEFPIRSV